MKLALVLVVATLTGCTTKEGSKTTMAAGGVVMVAGVVVGGAMISQEEGEDVYGGLFVGEVGVAAGGVLVVAAAINYLMLDGIEPTRAEVDAKAAQLQVPTYQCDVVELSVARGAVPSLDAALAHLQPKLAQAPFSSWNQFRLVARAEATFTDARPRAVAIPMGSVSATAVTTDARAIQISAELEDLLRQRHRYRTTTVVRGEPVLFGPVDLGLEPHALALTCR